MALRICKDCGKEYSTSAEKCPHCGNPHPVNKALMIIEGICALFILIWLVRACI